MASNSRSTKPWKRPGFGIKLQSFGSFSKKKRSQSAPPSQSSTSLTNLSDTMTPQTSQTVETTRYSSSSSFIQQRHSHSLFHSSLLRKRSLSEGCITRSATPPSTPTESPPPSPSQASQPSHYHPSQPSPDTPSTRRTPRRQSRSPTPRNRSPSPSPSIKSLEGTPSTHISRSLKPSRPQKLKSTIANTFSNIRTQVTKPFRLRKEETDSGLPPPGLKREVKTRKREEDAEKFNAKLAVDYFLRLTRICQLKKGSELLRMGSRMQKYWFEVTPNETSSDMQRKPSPLSHSQSQRGQSHTEPSHLRPRKRPQSVAISHVTSTPIGETESPSHSCLLLSIAPIPRHCPLLEDGGIPGERVIREETMEELQNNMKQLAVHPFLQPVEYIYYLADRKQMIIVQPFWEHGSLKDIIHKDKPTKDWSKKYNQNCNTGLPRSKVALYGRQILEAMTFLYRKNFPVLGHVQSGNIFVHTVCDEEGNPVCDKKGNPKEICKLGGYENTLLGYRSRFYRMCKDHVEHMDVIMFGHLVFEMSCGYELTTLVPEEEDYKAVKDEGVKDVLHLCFDYFKKPVLFSILFILFWLNLWIVGSTHTSTSAVIIVIFEKLLLLLLLLIYFAARKQFILQSVLFLFFWTNLVVIGSAHVSPVAMVTMLTETFIILCYHDVDTWFYHRVLQVKRRLGFLPPTIHEVLHYKFFQSVGVPQ